MQDIEDKAISFKTLMVLIAIGFLARLFIMSTTYFGDIPRLYLPPSMWTEQGHFNIYSHINAHGGSLGWIYYPPGLFFVMAGCGKIISLLMPGFTDWLRLAYEWKLDQAMADPARFTYLFLMKSPYLVCDIILVALLLRLRDRRITLYTIIFWILNPAVIHSIYAVGQFDVFVALSICIAVCCYRNEKHAGASLALGVATALKVFPGILILCHSLISGRGARGKIKLIALGVAVPAVLTAPFLLGGDFSVLESYFTYPGIGSAGEGGFLHFLTRLTPVVIAAAIVLLRHRAWEDYFADAIIALLFTFMLTIRFDDRYILWAFSALMLRMSRSRRDAVLPILIFVFSLATTLTYYGEFVTGLFSPLAGKAITIQGIAEYCISKNIYPPHKIFKLLLKIFMIALVLKIFLQKTGKEAGVRDSELGVRESKNSKIQG